VAGRYFVTRHFGEPARDLPQPRKVRDVAHSDREASVFCTADHGDGAPRWRVAVLTKNPRKLVTDAEEVDWPGVPFASVLAVCTECWKVPCEQCSLPMEGEYCCAATRPRMLGEAVRRGRSSR